MADDQQKILRIANSFREANKQFFQATRKDAELSGLTPIQYLGLRLLKQYPAIGLSELAVLMHAGASTTSGIVDRMVQAGWVARDRLESDRRAIVLHLTPKGEALLEETNGRIMRRLSALLELSEEDIGHLLRIHGKIIQILERVGEE